MLSLERGLEAQAGMYAAGTSPCHVRGGADLSAVDHVAKYVPGGVQGVRSACSDPALREFLDQRFDASCWYDVLPMAPLSELLAKLNGMDVERYLLERTREHAHRDLAGLYRLLMRAVSARTVA